MVPNKIIVSSDNENVHGLCVVGIFKLECVENCLKSGARDGNIVSMYGVPLVLSDGGGGWGKEVVESGI